MMNCKRRSGRRRSCLIDVLSQHFLGGTEGTLKNLSRDKAVELFFLLLFNDIVSIGNRMTNDYGGEDRTLHSHRCENGKSYKYS
jgi:hypothetical protein